MFFVYFDVITSSISLTSFGLLEFSSVTITFLEVVQEES